MTDVSLILSENVLPVRREELDNTRFWPDTKQRGDWKCRTGKRRTKKLQWI